MRSYIIAFIACWQLTLVLSAVLPLVIVACFIEEKVTSGGIAQARHLPHLHIACQLRRSTGSGCPEACSNDRSVLLGLSKQLCTRFSGSSRPDLTKVHALQSGDAYNLANQTATEAFSSIRTVAAFGLGPLLSKRYDGLLIGERPWAQVVRLVRCAQISHACAVTFHEQLRSSSCAVPHPHLCTPCQLST